MSAFALIALGLALLAGGAELLVRGASALARLAGVPALIVGLTVVAYGTSAPELAVSVRAALAGRADLALGNVVGSNIFNVLFILGLSALVAPLAVSRQLLRLDAPLMVAVSGLLWLSALDGRISRLEGLAFAGGIAAYTLLLVLKGRREGRSAAERAQDRSRPQAAGGALRALAGLVLLVAGAQFLVDGATDLARQLGISELVIGLTIVAGGTSLPELATSLVAALRGERDIAVGNIVGSNIFNILAVLGFSAGIAGGVAVAPAALAFDIPVLAAVAAVCLPVFFSRGEISRPEGLALLLGYALYVAWLVRQAGG